MNQLRHLDEFTTALKDYKVSAKNQKILQATNLVLLTGVSSSGRNTIIHELAKTGEYHFIVSDTTRKPRKNNGVMEQNGVEYWFKSEEEFLEDLKKGNYLEAEVIHQQQVSGISIKELAQSQREGKIAITDIDIGGVKNVLAAKPDVKAIMVLPPSFQEWLRRFKERGEMDKDEEKRRLRTACTIYETALNDDRFMFVVNDKLAEAVALIHQIAMHGEVSQDYEDKGKQLAEILLADTKKYLHRSYFFKNK